MWSAQPSILTILQSYMNCLTNLCQILYRPLHQLRKSSEHMNDPANKNPCPRGHSNSKTKVDIHGDKTLCDKKCPDDCFNIFCLNEQPSIFSPGPGLRRYRYIWNSRGACWNFSSWLLKMWAQTQGGLEISQGLSSGPGVITWRNNVWILLIFKKLLRKVIRNVYHHLWTHSPQSLGIPWTQTDKNISCWATHIEWVY